MTYYISSYKKNILLLICRLIEKEKTFTLWRYRDKYHTHITYVCKAGEWRIYYYYKNRIMKKIEITSINLNSDWNVINSALDYITFNYILLNHGKLGPENIVNKIKTIRRVEDFIKERLHL